MLKTLVLALALVGCASPPATKSTPVWLAAQGCKGAQTSLDFTVQVDTKNCAEDRNAPNIPMPGPDYATLNCATLSGGGNVKVLFPRQEWHSLMQRGIGAIDAGPGK